MDLLNWIRKDLTEADVNELCIYIEDKPSEDQPVTTAQETEPNEQTIDLTERDDDPDSYPLMYPQLHANISHTGFYAPNTIIDLSNENNYVMFDYIGTR